MPRKILEFTEKPILGGFQEGITRRDPSPVICVDNVFYVYYSRTTESLGGYTATIWYATSSDGHTWNEQCQALGRGGAGQFDEHAVFTPSIFVHDDTYYMTYTAVPEPFYNGTQPSHPYTTKTAIGLAVADTPNGPWHRVSDKPILEPSTNHSDFDSLRVDDSCILKRNGKFWLYYKGRQFNCTPRQTKMGLAFAEHPRGPWVKYENNPVLDSGHEVCVWPEANGVSCLVCNVGPQGNTYQYSDDGISFNRTCDIVPPKAPGPFREDHFQEDLSFELQWGISMKEQDGWAFLCRFDMVYDTNG